MFSVKSYILVALFCIACLTGCFSTPDHSNTLIFGTETKFAIDVSSSSTTQLPEITVGYKRTEAVWLPLLANQKNEDEFTPAPCSSDNTLNDCKFQATNSEDAYSVLASFGAKFGGEADSDVNNPTSGSDGQSLAKGSAQASGGIAQYFATGLAAQKLAAEGGASLVTVQSGNTKPKRTAVEVLMEERGLSEQESQELLKQATKRFETKQVLVDEIVKRLSKDGNVETERLKTIGEKLKGDYPDIGSFNKLISATTVAEVKEVVGDIASIDARDGEKHPLDALIAETF
ncbi:hypothetical protein [Glaciecola sp. 1036]|uniref:hypothetical protein n=1 Tax=Alteromonadaceae TaxID=72275 RepID=UPI003CFBCB34